VETVTDKVKSLFVVQIHEFTSTDDRFVNICKLTNKTFVIVFKKCNNSVMYYLMSRDTTGVKVLSINIDNSISNFEGLCDYENLFTNYGKEAIAIINDKFNKMSMHIQFNAHSIQTVSTQSFQILYIKQGYKSIDQIKDTVPTCKVGITLPRYKLAKWRHGKLDPHPRRHILNFGHLLVPYEQYHVSSL
jgi:hypothetical protein